MVLRVGGQRRAPLGQRDASHALRHQLLHHDHGREHAERPHFRGMMRRADLVNRCDGDAHAREHQQQRDRCAGQRFRLAEAERVFLGGVAIGDAHTRPHRE